MEKPTTAKIRDGLKAYIQSLYGHQLYDLVQTVKSAASLEHLPSHFKDALGLRRYFLTSNLLKTVQEQLQELIPWRCLNGDLLSPEQSIWVANQTLKQRLVRNSSTTEIPPIVQSYFKYFHNQKSLPRKPAFSLKFYDHFELSGARDCYISVEASRLVLSEVKSQVEHWLETFPVRDVHFIASDAFYINCSLENSKWHSVDITVSAGKVRCVPLTDKSDYEEPSHLWNTSGKDGREVTPEKAQPGESGSSGLPGFNGGHVLFVAKEYENMSDLVVVSNGGRGGRGQYGGDGVDGRNGEDGRELSVEEMFIRFPVSVNSDTLRGLVVENTRRTGGVEEFLYEPAGALDKYNGKVVGIVTDFYARGKLPCGVKYEVGFGKGVFQKTAFCLIRGAPGSKGAGGGSGGVGGAGGLGGQKGTVTLLYSNNSFYNGHIESNNAVTVVLKPGRRGRMGIDGNKGKDGTHGRNGKDVGYMAWSGKEVSGFPPGKYHLQLKDEEITGRKQESVYCKLLDKHITIEPRRFASIRRSIQGADVKIEVAPENLIMEVDGNPVQRKNENVKEMLKRIEKFKLMQKHAREISSQMGLVDSSVRVEFTAEWWMRQILS